MLQSTGFHSRIFVFISQSWWTETAKNAFNIYATRFSNSLLSKTTHLIFLCINVLIDRVLLEEDYLVEANKFFPSVEILRFEFSQTLMVFSTDLGLQIRTSSLTLPASLIPLRSQSDAFYLRRTPKKNCKFKNFVSVEERSRWKNWIAKGNDFYYTDFF